MRPGTLAAFFTLLLSAFACTNDPIVLAQRHTSRGDRYVADKNYGDAIVEYRRALAYTPRAGQTHLKLAETYIKNDDLRNAFPEFLRAADSLPDDQDAQLKAGNLLLMAGRFQEAKTR